MTLKDRYYLSYCQINIQIENDTIPTNTLNNTLDTSNYITVRK